MQVFYANHVRQLGLTILSVGRPHLYFQNNNSFYVRARMSLVIYVLLDHSIFLFEKSKLLITIFLLLY